MSSDIILRHFPRSNYMAIWEMMRSFTTQRQNSTSDELWIVEHFPVFTQGQAGKAEHILNPHDIPIVQTDRGGQVTYHGPGQLVAYPLLDIRRQGLTIRQLVTTLEQTVIDLLAHFAIPSYAEAKAPGIYVDQAKICSIGLRIRHGCCYHGIALNIDMDLTPFTYINPCGITGLKMTQIKHYIPDISQDLVLQQFIGKFVQHFGYHEVQKFRD